MNRTLAVGLLFIFFEACSDASAPRHPSYSPPGPPPDTSVGATPRILEIPTADRSGTVVHPDYLRMPASWPGPARFLAITTYPKADPSREWPSLFVQDSVSTRWHLLAGTPNPLLQPPEGTIYSDPDLVFEPDSGELWMYVRLVNSVWNVLQIIKSRDGVLWSTPVDIDSARNHGMISPAIVRRDRGEWYLWSVHADQNGCQSAGATVLERRTSDDGLHWSRPDTALIAGHPWHIDVTWVQDWQEWWAVYVEGCLPTAVRLATSPDGLAWTVLPSPVVTAGVIPQFNDVVYRSSVAVEGDSVRFWFSGARWDSDSVSDSGWVWHAAASVEGRADLMLRLSRAPETGPQTIGPRGRRPVPYPEAP